VGSGGGAGAAGVAGSRGHGPRSLLAKANAAKANAAIAKAAQIQRARRSEQTDARHPDALWERQQGDLSTVYELPEEASGTLASRLNYLADQFAQYDSAPGEEISGSIYAAIVQMSQDLLQEFGVCPDGGVAEKFAEKVLNSQHQSHFAAEYARMLHDTQLQVQMAMRAARNAPLAKVQSAIDGVYCLQRIRKAFMRISMPTLS